jgi:hypothetical protein
MKSSGWSCSYLVGLCMLMPRCKRRLLCAVLVLVLAVATSEIWPTRAKVERAVSARRGVGLTIEEAKGGAGCLDGIGRGNAEDGKDCHQCAHQVCSICSQPALTAFISKLLRTELA